MPHLVSIPKGAIMSCRLARIRLRIGVSIPKGAIMRYSEVMDVPSVIAVSIPKGAIMSVFSQIKLILCTVFQFQKVRL